MDYDVTEAEAAFLGSMSSKATSRCVCGGKGYVLSADNKAVLCKCTLARMYIEKFAEVGIPAKYANMTMDQFKITQDAYGENLPERLQNQKSQARLFMEKYIKYLPAVCADMPIKIKRRGVHVNVHSPLLIGGGGSGKTMLAALVAVQAVRLGISVKFYEWGDIFTIMNDFGRREEQDELVQEFKSLNLLVIDGVVDCDFDPKCFKFQLGRACRARVLCGKPVLITIGDTVRADYGDSWKGLLETCTSIRLPSQPKNKRPFL